MPKKTKNGSSQWRKYGYNATRDNKSYSEWRYKVKKRYKICMVCAAKNNLEAHHVIPFSVNRANRYKISNGRVLCQHCHSLYHNEYDISECNLITLRAFVRKYKKG